MNKFLSLLTFTSLTLSSSLVASAPAHALSFSLENQVGDNYSYTITLDGDDSLAATPIADQVILTNLSGVINASSSSPYDLIGFDATSANFSLNTNTSGPTTLTGVIQLESPDSLDNLEYQVFFSDGGTPSVASGSITPVPFGVAPNLGIILVVGGFGLRHLKRKFKG